jgi:hypothetical protein
MKRLIWPLLMAAPLAACATAAPITQLGNRPLSQSEKTALASSLSQTLKDPGAAQFKWMPLNVTDQNPTGYCGLVNGKNSFGGYNGYRPFFAMISKAPDGGYSSGKISYIAGAPTTLFGSDTTDDAIANGLTEGSCKHWGYENVETSSQ